MLKKIRVFGAALSLVAILALPQAATANHSWGNYHWARTANPFSLKIGDNLTSNWHSYLAQASSDWSASDVLDTNVVPGLATSKNCRPTSGRVEVCNSKYGNNGWLGVANIWANGNHITQGTVKLNDSYFNTSTYNSPAWRQMVTCQEVGHTFGLDHQDENFTNPNLGTCMDYTNDPSTNQHPNAHDYEELDFIYSHLDSSTTIGQSTARSADVNLNGPSDWGQELRQSSDGKTSLYARDLGNGQRIFTFVYWADGGRAHAQQ